MRTIRHYRRQYVALPLLGTAAFGLLGTALEHLAPPLTPPAMCTITVDTTSQPLPIVTVKQCKQKHTLRTRNITTSSTFTFNQPK